MKYFYTLLLFLLTTISAAQVFTPKWKSCYGGSDVDEGGSLISLNNKYWIIANTNSTNGDISYNHGKYDVWLLNIDSIGNLINEKTYGGLEYDGGFDIIDELNDSVFYIASMSQSIDGDISSNPWPGAAGNLWVLQVNKQGDILWETMAGGTGEDILSDMKVTNDGGVLLFGNTTSNDGDVADNHGSWDNWLIKIDGNGQKLWSKCYGGEGPDWGTSVIQTDDGGYLLISSTDGEGGGNYDTSCNFHSFWDVWLLKLDLIGNIEWQQCYGGHYGDAGDNAIEVPDGYIIIGGTESDDGDVSGYHGEPGPQNKNGNDIWVFKIDKTGNMLWQNCLGGTNYDWARNIFTTSDGGFMVVGKTLSNDGDVSGFHGRPGIFHDLWFAKIDSVGNLLWQYCYGTDADELIYRGVIQKNDWDYVLAYSRSYVYNIPDVCVVELYDSTVGIKEVRPVEEEMVSIFPNPANNTVTFSYTLPEKINTGTLELFDSNGKRVNTMQTENSGKKTMDCSSLPSGIYYYRFTAGMTINSGKFIIRH